MNKPNNRRVQITKRMLKESLLEMLEHTSISNISVRSLCEEADVNRSTFYKHYTSQYEVFDEMQNDFLLQIEQCFQQNNGERPSYQETLTKKLTYMKENIRLCKVLIGKNAVSNFKQHLLNIPYIKQELSLNICKGSEEEIKYKKEFIISGSYHIIVRWLNDNCPETPEQVSAIILDITDKVLRQDV